MRIFFITSCLVVVISACAPSRSELNSNVPSAVNSAELRAEVKSKQIVKVKGIILAEPRLLDKEADDISKSQMLNHLGAAVDQELDIRVEESASANVAELRLEVREFKKRLGSSLGASRPAKVAFTLTLNDSLSGELLWKATYFHADAALSDNFLAVGQGTSNGSGWNDATALLKKGLGQALREFNRARRAFYLSK